MFLKIFWPHHMACGIQFSNQNGRPYLRLSSSGLNLRTSKEIPQITSFSYQPVVLCFGSPNKLIESL